MRQLKLPSSRSAVAALCLLLSATLPADTRQAEEALATYREFLQARENASTLEELYPYLPSRQVQRLKEVPPETLAMYGKGVLEPDGLDAFNLPDGDFELASYSVEGNEIDLQLTAERRTDVAKVLLRQQVTLQKEGGDWKIDDPRPSSWEVIGRLPATDPGEFAAADPGPGRVDWPGVTITSAEQFVLSAERTVSATNSPTKLLWDPNGRYVLVGNNDEIALYALPALEPIWSGRAPSSFFGGTLSPDGRYYLSLQPLREPSRVDLDLNARLDASPEAPFFASVGLPAVRDSVGEVYRYDMERYHPTEDVFAVAISGETADAIVFEGPGETPSDMPVEGPEGALAWAPDGKAFAFVKGFRQPGGAILVHSYPDGSLLHRLTATDFGPGGILFSPDARKVASVGSNSNGAAVAVWDVGSGEVVATLNDFEQAVFAPDSGQVIGLRDDGRSVQEGISDTLVVLDVSSEEEVARLSAFPKGENTFPANISAIGISPNGRYVGAVAKAGDEHVLRVWEIVAAE